MQSLRHFFLSVSVAYLVVPRLGADALRHSFNTFLDSRTIIGPVGTPFGYVTGGKFSLQVFDFELTNPSKKEKDEISSFSGLTAGFYLHRFQNDAAYTKYLNTLQSNSSMCSFEFFLDRDSDGKEILDDDTMVFEEVGEVESAENGVLLMMKPRQTKWKPMKPTIEYTMKPGEAGLYFLTYQVCASHGSKDSLKHVRSSFELDFHFLNVDASGQDSYLPAGELHLPFLFFFFAMSYLICLSIWIMNIINIGNGGNGLFDTHQRPVVYPIHKLMGALLCFKFLSMFFESIRYHVIRVTGHAEIWSVAYYSITFVKGIFLFTVILLIGTGWSFVKPFLNASEKRIIFGILFLQVINNVAIAILSHETTGEKSFGRWNAILHLVDIICCCSVLLPIVWQVNSLEKSLPTQAADKTPNDVAMDEYDLPEEDDLEDVDVDEESKLEQDREKGQILSKLKLFRSFYLLVVAYIYLTRIIVYIFATLLDYQHLWMRYGIIELVTLAFYVVVGILFRPMVENPYLSLKQQQQKADGSATGIAMTSLKKGSKP